MSLLYDLDEITEHDRGRVGGKAVALAKLHRAGHRVPRTVCLTTEAYDRFVEHGSLRAVIQQELGRKRLADMRWEELWDASLRIRSRFQRTPMPVEISDPIAVRLEGALGEQALVVRSSAPDEDARGASFAGLHDSYVGVRGLPGILEAIRSVWASLWTDRALLYRRELGLRVDRSAMAVVLQELVAGTTSGIAFGVHPTATDRMAVEAVYGLNQGLVDGAVEPDRWTLDKATGHVLHHEAPSRRTRWTVLDGEGTVEPVPPAWEAAPPLDATGLADVYAALRATGDLFGSPQDVEWTRVRDCLVLLQSRPITTASAEAGDRRAWYLSLTRSLQNLRALRSRVEGELLPAMQREAAALAHVDPAGLDAAALASEIERRREAHDRWVDVYAREFIPLAHGIRLFGRFYNDSAHPEDPYEFMGLLAATPLLSVRRNRELGRLATRLREEADLRARLAAGEPGDDAFEGALRSFEEAFGGSVYADQACFADRPRLVRLRLALADATPTHPAASAPDVASLTERFLASVEAERRPLATELLDLGRASYRLRDDDNLYLARFEALVLEAVEEARRRLQARGGAGAPALDPDDVVRALRHPNRVAEPESDPVPTPRATDFRERPRQLVGQPAGPGVATGEARVVGSVDDLFGFRAGEVLVCDAIDPNMTFVVPLASAVVERRGGMLVHGAIIAREYGLPCVTGVPDAVLRIATGDRLTVDGYLGIVTVLAAGSLRAAAR